MAKVECEIEDTLVEVKGKPVKGVVATCGRCDNCVEVPGEDCARVRAQLVSKLRESCPEEGTRHHYVFPALCDNDRGDLMLENADSTL